MALAQPALHSLARLGRHGLHAPAAAVLLGMALPDAGQAMLWLVKPAAMLLFGVMVGLVEPGRVRRAELPAALALTAATLLVTPLLVAAFAPPLGLDAADGWLLLLAGCPPAGGAALVAALLGLPMRTLLLGQLAAFAALPATAPLVTLLAEQEGAVDAGLLFWRVLLVVGLPSAVALLLRRAAGEPRVAAAAGPLRGLGVIALCGIGMAAGAGLPQAAAGHALVPMLAGLVLVSAIGALLGLLAVLACSPGVEVGGARLAAALALGGGVRNVSLLWGASIGVATPGGALMLQLASAWTLLLPSMIGLVRRAGPVRMVRATALLALALPLLG
jgi:hypothetical protein